MVVGVQGLALDFQNPSDFSARVSCTSTCTYFQNASGGNSFIRTSGIGYVISQTPLVMTYSATTLTEGNTIFVRLYDSSHTLMDTLTTTGVYAVPLYSRCELKIIGNQAYLYVNGVQKAVGAPLLINPSYIGWMGYDDGMGSPPGSVDDIVWGDTESRYIFGMPENGYFLQKDILSPASSGFYRTNQTVANGSPTLIFSTTFPSTFGKNGGNTETVILTSPTSGTQLTYSTGTAYAGSIQWNLSQFFASNANYGLYQTEITPQLNSSGFATSDWILYIGSGASIHFDKNSYAVGETATATVIVSDGYYDLATYSYHVVIQDIYGTEVYDAPISFSASPHTGTATYQWATTDNEGVYYGLIYAKRLSDNVELLMNYDTADLNSNLIINGYVFNAENATVISGATVNVTQGVTTDSLTTPADGNYSSTSSFSANAPTTIVASKSGYETYQHVFTPLYAGTIQINLTLMPTSPTYTGIALGGIARTPPYNRTINSATVYILNSTDGHSYTATTNAAGYYIQNNMAGASHWFDIWGSKTGFSNSSIYQKLVVGI